MTAAGLGGAKGQGAAGGRHLVRGLDAMAAAAIIVGIIIGSGIFRTPNIVAGIVGASGLIFVVYIVAGALVLVGALCYAELGAMMPKSGGAYVYIREAFGDLPAFLLGWISFLITQVGSLAAVALFFGELGGVLFAYDSPWIVKGVAAAAVLLLAFTNTLGVRVGGHVQVAFTAFKIFALSAVIVVGLLAVRGEPLSLTPTFPARWDFSVIQLIGLAMVPALFAYDGWTNANNVAEEIQDVQRNLPRALLLGVSFVIGIYLLANFAYLWALGLQGTADAEGRAAANVFTAAFGSCIPIAGQCLPPDKLITLIIFVSLFGSLNGQTIAYPRLFFAMAKDGLFVFPRVISSTHPRYHTPHWAILAQAVWALILILWGTFETLAEAVVFASFIFYGLAVLGLIVLRIRRPGLKRPYRVPLYPWLPILFIMVTLAFTVNLFIRSPGLSLLGLGIIVAGVPFFYVLRAFTDRVVQEDVTVQDSLPE